MMLAGNWLITFLGLNESSIICWWARKSCLKSVDISVELETILTKKSDIVIKGRSAGTIRQASCLALIWAAHLDTRVSRNLLPRPVERLEE
jgi:cytidylate kinase